MKFMITLLIGSVMMTIVSAAYIIICRLIGNRWSPKWRYYTWLIILAGFLIPIKPQIGQPVMDLNSVTTRYFVEMEAGVWLDAYSVLAAIWIIGVAVSLIINLVRHRMFMCSVNRLAEDSVDPQLNHMLSSIAGEMKLDTVPALLIVPGLGTPMLAGLKKPVVLLPKSEYDARSLALILKHELTHYKHKDIWVKAVAMVCRAIHWFNPVLSVILHSIDQACELFCDAAVLEDESAETRKAYCSSILDSIRQRNELNNHTMFSTGFGMEKKLLRSRIILAMSAAPARAMKSLCIMALLLTLLSGSLFAFGRTVWEGGSLGNQYNETTTAATMAAVMPYMEEEGSAAAQYEETTMAATAP